MNLSPEWVSRLQQAEIEAQHWSSVGAPSAPDREVFAHAREAGWVVLTQDLDFAQVLFETASKGPSTILLRLRNEIGTDEFGRVVAVLRELAAEITAGALVVIDDQRVRIRPLPLATTSHQGTGASSG